MAAWLKWWSGVSRCRWPPSQHPFKYRLVFVRNGQRVVGYDNERGKGDHKHVGARQLDYRFTDIDTLVADFLRDVEKLA